MAGNLCDKVFSSNVLENQSSQYPYWYSSETGIYRSKHPSRDLPSDPFRDVVSVIFSNKHDGVLALIDSSSGSSIPYSELYRLVESMASGLHHMGVSQGDVVLILLPNCIYYPIIFLGVLLLGGIVTTMNPVSTMSEIKKQSTDSNVCLAFSESQKVKELQALGVPAIGVPQSMSFDVKPNGFSSFYTLISGHFSFVPRPVIKQQDKAAIMYSSGTTGMSKGVVLTHRNLIAMVELFVRFEASQYDHSSLKNVYLAILPMFHIYGLSLFVMGLLSLGSTVVVMKKFGVIEVVKAIDRFNVTHLPVVPPIVTALTKSAKDFDEKSFKSLKQVSCGAAPLSGKIIEDFVQALPHVDFIQVMFLLFVIESFCSFFFPPFCMTYRKEKIINFVNPHMYAICSMA